MVSIKKVNAQDLKKVTEQKKEILPAKEAVKPKKKDTDKEKKERTIICSEIIYNKPNERA